MIAQTPAITFKRALVIIIAHAVARVHEVNNTTPNIPSLIENAKKGVIKKVSPSVVAKLAAEIVKVIPLAQEKVDQAQEIVESVLNAALNPSVETQTKLEGEPTTLKRFNALTTMQKLTLAVAMLTGRVGYSPRTSAH